MRLLLFDIDGTLIRSQGAGRETMIYALKQLFGTAGPVDDYRMDGKTDPRIITDLLTAAKVPRQQINDRLPEIYLMMAQHGRQIFPERGITPCPGVPELLAALALRQDAVIGLLTGNSSHTAPLKLAAAGIDPAQFRVGAYGSDHMDRNALPAIAMERAAKLTGRPFQGSNTVIIGDTPADILCARTGLATAVAVASGWHSTDALSRYQPDHILESLHNTQEVINILLPV